MWDGVTWTDETSRLMDAGGSVPHSLIWRDLTGAANYKPATCSFNLRSPSNRFSPFNASSPLYPYISDSAGYGTPVQFQVAVRDTGGVWHWETMFTGYIDRLTLTSLKYNRVKIDAIDNSHPFLQDKRSTIILQNQTPADWINYLTSVMNISTGDKSIATGMNVIPFVWMDNENIMSEIKETAQTEGGIVFFDRTGKFIFYGAESFVTDPTLTTSQHNFTVSNMREANADWDWQSVYNGILVPYSPRRIGSAVEIFSLSDSVTVNAGDSKTITAKHTLPALVVSSSIEKTIVTAGGDDISGSVSVAVTSYAQYSEVVITNNHASDTANVKKLVLSGVPLVGRTSEQIEKTVVSAVVGDPATRRKILPAHDNPAIQTKEAADFLASMLVDRLAVLRGEYSVQSPCLPDLERYTRVTLTDSDSGFSEDAFITGLNWSFKKGVFDATYKLISAENWVPDTGNYFQIGVDILGGGKVAFY